MKLNDVLGEIESLGYSGRSFKPHKPLFLLALIDLIDKGLVRDNKFYYDRNLRQAFSSYFQVFRGPTDKDRPLAPFFHLKNSVSFWHLKPVAGMESELETLSTVGSSGQLHEVVEYGFLSPEVYELLRIDSNRQIIKNKLILLLRSAMSTYVSENPPPSLSLFRHEADAIELIASAVKRYNAGRCISNLVIFDNMTNQYYECDLLIISYHKVYIVELKHWSGSIKITPYNWIRNGKYIPDPHKTNNFKAKVLRGVYAHRFRTYPSDLYFESVIVLTNPDAEIEGANNPKYTQHCPTFSSIDHLIQHIRYTLSRDHKILTLAQINSLHDFLFSLNQPKQKSSFTFSDYEIVQNITQDSDLAEVVVRSKRGPQKSLFRFRRFTFPVSQQPTEKEQRLKLAYNTLNAVAQIGDHPNILKVWPVPDDTGAVTEGSEWSEEGTLRDLIYETGRQGLEENRALELCRGILSGLHAAHAKGVIHRAVKPENILMVNGVPKLMNFDLSYQLASDSSVTVIPDAGVLKVDPYTAPEVYALEDVDESTDLFSVGVILFELLCGSVPFKSSRDLPKLGGRLPDDQLAKLADRGISKGLTHFIDRVVRLDRTERFSSTKEALHALGASRTELEEAKIPPVPNRILNPGETHDVYEIVRFIGEGTEAQVYEVAKTHGQRVALKVFHKDIPISRIQQEETNAGSVRSSYLAHAKRLGHWKNDRYYIEMDYLDGHLMREDILQERRPDEEAFIQVASCLLEAVQTLHERTIEDVRDPLIHGDIKPDNIMLRGDGTAVLFDFGCSGPARVDTYQGTEGYVAPDLVQGADLQFCESGDLFALGISLFEWAFGKRPYSTLCVGARPELPTGEKADLGEPIIGWLLKAVQATSEKRFENVRVMAEAFSAAVAECNGQATGEPQEIIEEEIQASTELSLALEGTEGPGNPFVAYLNSLHNASECNVNALAEAQALSSYFGHIHVPLKVTDFIYEQLSSSNSPHIILTGHAGDGKSTVALELFKRYRSIPPETPLSRPLRESEDLSDGENCVVLVKDLSELGDINTSKLLRKALDKQDKRYLIVSNTGALLNGFKALCELRGEDWLRLQNALLRALEEKSPSEVRFAGTPFLIINLARMDTISTACAVFERMLKPELWEDCEGCGYREGCPILFNVLMLRENLHVVKERVELVYRRLFEYGVRLTLRQLTGHLAYALTGGLGYEDIEQIKSNIPNPPLRRFLFFNRFFGDSGDLPDNRADQLEAVRRIRTLHPGRCTHMGLERPLWCEEETPLPAMIEGSVKELFTFLCKAGSQKTPEVELPVWAARMQVRRIIYFFGRFFRDEDERRYITTFLHSPMLWDFHRWQKTDGKLSTHQRKELQRGILHVLQEHFTGVRIPENNNSLHDVYITLNRRNQEIRQSAQIVLAKYPADNFEFRLTPFITPIGDTRFEAVIRQGALEKELALDLPFLDYVKNRFEGEIAQKLQSFFVDRLERFKVQLLKNQHREDWEKMLLVRLQLDQSFRTVELSVADGKLEVI